METDNMFPVNTVSCQQHGGLDSCALEVRKADLAKQKL